MARAPDWSEEEFALLVLNDVLSDEALAARLPRRTIDAIKIVRSGIHDFHQDGDFNALSKMMISYLKTSRTPIVCPVCRHRLNLIA